MVCLTKEKQKLTMKISDTKTKQVFLETHKNNQGSWIELQYNSKKNICLFMKQVSKKNNLYNVKYLTKSKIGNYIFPEQDD